MSKITILFFMVFLIALDTSSSCQVITFDSQKELLGSNINSSYNEVKPIISSDGKTIYFCRQNHPRVDTLDVERGLDDQ